MNKTETVAVGAMHQCRVDEMYSTCMHCGATAEKLNVPCQDYMRNAALRQALSAPQPAAQALDAPVDTTDPRITAIEQSILDHHFALDTRQHGGIAAANALDAICTAMGMPWIQGAESARRAAIAAKQGVQ